MDRFPIPETPPKEKKILNTIADTDNDKLNNISKFYLIISNISKKNNIRSLLLTAASFQCDTVFLAGQPSFNVSTDTPKPLLSEEGSKSKMKIIHYRNLSECIDHIRSNLNVKIVGVEITDQSKNLNHKDVFHRGQDIVFMMGNEGTGMSKSQMTVCDEFIKIRQFGNGTASLNVNVAAGVVLHSFDAWRKK